VVGRSSELAHVDQLLEVARAGTAGVLAIEGEAGIGKTTMLRAAAARADGFTRLWAHGVESEAALGYASLLELLVPVRDRLAEVPAAQARALAAALGWGPTAAPGDPYLVAAGTLSMLAAAAETVPLLVLVDDLQWIDAASAAALLFAARRMHHDRVAFFLAARPDAISRALNGVDVMTLSGLSAPHAGQLLGDHLARSVVAKLIAHVDGNPLALLEVAARLTPAQRRGTAALPDPLPVGRKLEAVYEPSLISLSPSARQAVLLLAAAQDGTADQVATALRRHGVDAHAALDEAEQRGIVRRDGDTLHFRHPLVRSTAWRLATPQQRRDAHRALADAARTGDAITRTWHLAQAVSGADDDLADDLVEVAQHARARRGFAASSTALERAAALTTDAATATARLAAAVRDAFVSGDVDRTRALASRVLGGDADSHVRGDVLYTLGRLEQYAGSVPAAIDLLDEAVDLTAGRTRVWSLAELAFTQFRLNDLSSLGDTAGRISRFADATDPEQQVLADFVTGVSKIVGGDADAGRRLVGRAMEVLDSEPSLRDDPRFLIHALLGASWLGDTRRPRARLERRMRVAREQGALGVLMPALALMAYGRALLDDHAGAFADVGEAAELAEQLHFVAEAAVAVEMLAYQSAARGMHDEARRQLERATTLVARAGTGDVAAHLVLTAAFCALCSGGLDETVRLLEARIAADGGRGPMGEPLGVAPILVEAYVGLGRTSDAAALAEQYAAASPSPTPATAALIVRCRALAAVDDHDAAQAFDEALAANAEAPNRFETARTRLMYGARLRRSGRRIDARDQLRQARDAFAGMDLTHWATRAEEELQATGERARQRHPLPEVPLTSQETRVAMLVAQGLSNREVAAALFLSPKTIEHHLRASTASADYGHGPSSPTHTARRLLSAPCRTSARRRAASRPSRQQLDTVRVPDTSGRVS
jgi:DNA-binding CsgD family transcriptional regulator